MVEIEIDALVILPVPLRKNFQLGRLYRLPRFKERFAHSGPPADHFSRILPNFSCINFVRAEVCFFHSLVLLVSWAAVLSLDSNRVQQAIM